MASLGRGGGANVIKSNADIAKDHPEIEHDSERLVVRSVPLQLPASPLRVTGVALPGSVRKPIDPSGAQRKSPLAINQLIHRLPKTGRNTFSSHCSQK